MLGFAVNPSQSGLREALAEVDRQLVDLEHSSVGRVRLVLTDILGRSAKRSEQIRIELFVMSKTIRIELSGPALALPEDLVAGRDDDPSFPSWLLTHLVDGWGLDHRKSERAIWLLVDRG